ncbi:hypothetical protein GHT09_018315 [Marmota monax]|uniref:Uncharacterized protein n=1 Tax=Marmota monax TaxID=9995 RepID=A0A834Q1L3_MARMO|nr:hypothetical protein GHT09_018315 [Marmota monax]
MANFEQKLRRYHCSALMSSKDISHSDSHIWFWDTLPWHTCGIEVMEMSERSCQAILLFLTANSLRSWDCLLFCVMQIVSWQIGRKRIPVGM